MHLTKTCRFALLLAIAPLAASPAAWAENWPQWRGAQLDGISHETNLPTTWSKTENVAWRIALPGPAGSTPVVWGDHIYLTSADKEDIWC